MKYFYEHPIIKLFIRFLKTEDFPIFDKPLRSAFTVHGSYMDSVEIDWFFLDYYHSFTHKEVIALKTYLGLEHTVAVGNEFDKRWNMYIYENYEIFKKYYEQEHFFISPSGDSCHLGLKDQSAIESLL